MSNEVDLEQDLIRSAYHFELPKKLIAERPVDGENRDLSKLLVYLKREDKIIHSTFREIKRYLPKDSTLFFNQTKVFPSRLKGEKPSGGKIELFLLSIVPDEQGLYSVLIKSNRPKNLNDHFLFAENVTAILIEKVNDGTFKVSFSIVLDEDYLNRNGLVPIPPYIRKGESDDDDKKNYQTVYAKHTGSVAAPTAGLHFTKRLINDLENSGFSIGKVTLHVGLGTFKPMVVEHIKDHQMHSEKFFVDGDNLELLKKRKPKVAVGTTTLRVLESIYQKTIEPNEVYSTNIFLHPGIQVQSIDALVTNFHLPESSLLMLVASLVGRKKILQIYAEAIAKEYRFFSYGDAMLIVL